MRYNVYALDKLSNDERSRLIDFLPKGMDYKIAGEEYEYTNYSTGIFSNFLQRVEGSVSISANPNFSNFLDQYRSFEDVEYVFFRNEVWHEITDWNYIRKDLRTYLFNRTKYYREQGKRYAYQALSFVGWMRDEGYEIECVINAPLPQNKYLREFLNGIAEIWKGLVSIHVYGKFQEADYFFKLNSWLTEINALEFERVICGEMNGLFNHKNGREKKNTDIHRFYHHEIIQTLNYHGIDEIYYFTLVANQTMMNWKNPPIYNRWLVDSVKVVDTVERVFE